MKFINTDGLSFIGPGSEWFWTAVSGLVLAVTFVAIYRQLRLQRSQGAIEQIAAFAREWHSERFLSYRLEVLVALLGKADPAHVPDGAAEMISNYWDGIGTLARAGHLDRMLLWESHGNTPRLWWAYLAPYCGAVRAQSKDPSISANFEWLAAEMEALDRRAGTDAPYDDVLLATSLERRVKNVRERLRVERALRSVILASPDGEPAASTAAASTGS